MTEETASILAGDRVERHAHQFNQSLTTPCRRSPQQRLELGEGSLNRVVVWRIGRQVEELAASLFDQLTYPRAFVRGEVVHDHHLPRPQRGY